MKKLKLGTRVLVNGIETFISELHADIKRGVCKVTTSNPTYVFEKNTFDKFTCLTSNNTLLELELAPEYGNYQVGDMVYYIDKGEVIEVNEKTVVVKFPEYIREFTLEGNYCIRDKYHTMITKQPVLKKLRVKLGEKK